MKIRINPSYSTIAYGYIIIVNELILPNNVMIFCYKYTHGVAILHHIFLFSQSRILTMKKKTKLSNTKKMLKNIEELGCLNLNNWARSWKKKWRNLSLCWCNYWSVRLCSYIKFLEVHWQLLRMSKNFSPNFDIGPTRSCWIFHIYNINFTFQYVFVLLNEIVCGNSSFIDTEIDMRWIQM